MNGYDCYNDDEYSGFETSAEVLGAIEELTGEEVLSNGSDAFTLWEDGILGEQVGELFVVRISAEQVLAAAWAITDPDETELFWGGRHTRAIEARS